MNHKHLIAGGLSNIILIKETVYDGCFFDLSSIVIMPIFELITFGVEAVLKRNKTPLNNHAIAGYQFITQMI